MRYLPYYRNIVSRLCRVYNDEIGSNYGVELLTAGEFEKKYNEPVNIDNRGGFYDPQNKIIVMFYEHIVRKREQFMHENSGDNGLTYLIRGVFHELEHRLQYENRKKLSGFSETDFFKLDMDNILLVMANFDKRAKDFYDRFHDNMFLEIDADIKGVNNAMYASKKLGIVNLNWKYYDDYRRYNEFRNKVYDLPFFIGFMNNCIRKQPQLFLNRNYGYFSNRAIYEFYQDDGSYKSLFEIMYNNKINQCDPYLRACMVSDFSFLESLDFDKLSLSELNYVLDNVRVVCDDYKRRKAYYDDNLGEAQAALSYISHYSPSDTTIKANIDDLSNSGYYKYLEDKLSKYSHGENTRWMK